MTGQLFRRVPETPTGKEKEQGPDTDRNIGPRTKSRPSTPTVYTRLGTTVFVNTNRRQRRRDGKRRGPGAIGTTFRSPKSTKVFLNLLFLRRYYSTNESPTVDFRHSRDSVGSSPFHSWKVDYDPRVEEGNRTLCTIQVKQRREGSRTHVRRGDPGDEWTRVRQEIIRQERE